MEGAALSAPIFGHDGACRIICHPERSEGPHELVDANVI
jgi:hypothetical protein